MPFPPFSEVSKAILVLLKQRNGKATTAELSHDLIKKFQLTEDDESAKSKSGESAWKSRLRNIKQLLIKNGRLVPDKPGVWKLKGK